MTFRVFGRLAVIVGLLVPAFGAAAPGPAPSAALRLPASAAASHAHTPPRKVILASALVNLSGPVETRLHSITQLLDQAARAASTRFAGRGLDLMVFPEFALCRETGITAAERAVSLDGPVLAALSAAARAYHTWIVIPMTLREAGTTLRYSNAAVLIDRAGRVSGIFRKVHPIADEHGVFEGGVTPGSTYPVFDCDFGRLGLMICWDMAYDESWDALAAGGAELVVLPTASPQTLRPSAQALRHRFYVVNSAPRDNSSVFDPIGRTIAQVTAAPGFVLEEIDLSFAILHWSETLHEGRALTDRFGASAGGTYSSREDTGVFWSNDPQRTIGNMIQELGLIEMPTMIDQMEAARLKASVP